MFKTISKILCAPCPKTKDRCSILKIEAQVAKNPSMALVNQIANIATEFGIAPDYEKGGGAFKSINCDGKIVFGRDELIG